MYSKPGIVLNTKKSKENKEKETCKQLISMQICRDLYLCYGNRDIRLISVLLDGGWAGRRYKKATPLKGEGEAMSY